MYQLDEAALVNGMPVWLHCEFPERCLAYNTELSRWHAQERARAGEARGYMYCSMPVVRMVGRAGRAGVAASPHLEGAPWHAYTGNAATGEHSWRRCRRRRARARRE